MSPTLGRVSLDSNPAQGRDGKEALHRALGTNLLVNESIFGLERSSAAGERD